jgi:uncharacterized delta-60 repeat protein
MSRRLRACLLLAAAALAGCPGPTDAGVDAPAVDGGAADAPPALDAPPGSDTPADAGPPPLPAIANPEPHRTPLSADGHDRLYGVVFAPDSSFYVVGVAGDSTDASADFRTVVAHFGADGELEPGFGTDGVAAQNLAVGTNGELARGIVLQSDGSIVVSATIEDTTAPSDPRDRDVALMRLTAAGELDPSFGEGGVRILDLSEGVLDGTTFRADAAYGLAVDAEDRIVLSCERVRDGNSDVDWAVVRLTPDGALDATFDGDGVFSLDLDGRNARARGVRVLPTGDVVLSGYYDVMGSGTIVPVIFALRPDGTLDPAFGGGDGIYTETLLAIQTEAYDVAILDDGRLVSAGYGRDAGTQNDLVAFRLSAAGVRDLTYGPDGAEGLVQLTEFAFADNARALHELPGGGTLHVGATRTSDAPAQADAMIWVLDGDGALDPAFDGDGWRAVNFAPGTVDHFWAADVDPRGERVVVVGIGGTDPAADDDGTVYLFPVP